MSTTAEMKEEKLHTPKQIIEDAKAEFTRAKDRLTKDFATTPDDKLNWSPAATARTPIHLIAHSAMAVEGIQKMFQGGTMPSENIADMDAGWRKAEKEFTSRQQVLSLLDKSCDAYLAWLDGITPDQLTSTLKVPFGEFPMTSVITWPADHLRNHAGQLEYLQTCYGDMDWHM